MVSVANIYGEDTHKCLGQGIDIGIISCVPWLHTSFLISQSHLYGFYFLGYNNCAYAVSLFTLKLASRSLVPSRCNLGFATSGGPGVSVKIDKGCSKLHVHELHVANEMTLMEICKIVIGVHNKQIVEWLRRKPREEQPNQTCKTDVSPTS